MRRKERGLGIVTGLAVIATLSALIAPAAQAAQSTFQDKADSGVQVIAHRGSSGAAPENTIAAVELGRVS